MPGLVVVDVNPTGQAAKLGVCKHDVLFKYNNSVLNKIEDLINPAISMVENKLTVIRGRDLLELKTPGGSLGVALVPYPIPDINIAGVGEVLARFRNEVETVNAEQRKVQDDARLDRINRLAISTTPYIAGHNVVNNLDVISAEFVGGVNMFRDIMATVTDLVGGRSGTMQNELKRAREICLANLKADADKIGANAVIGIRLDYSEISGGGKSMLFLVATGTAVIAEKI